jgi:hypothetical protein
MTKKRLLEEAIIKITQQAGLQMSGTFHLTSVSRDAGGVFIMEMMWPERKRLCEAVKRVVTGFPSDPESSCIALLPEVADEIILAAQSEPADFLPASGRTVAGEAPMGVHGTGDENVTQM